MQTCRILLQRVLLCKKKIAACKGPTETNVESKGICGKCRMNERADWQYRNPIDEPQLHAASVRTAEWQERIAAADQELETIPEPTSNEIEGSAAAGQESETIPEPSPNEIEGIAAAEQKLETIPEPTLNEIEGVEERKRQGLEASGRGNWRSRNIARLLCSRVGD
ncbi:hypothetical protein SBOR_9607 [Sclerotinia borealis F-4128]|uniref:Uncharacterized protein n=1 Tax=Sclerotinia borealis (strain F-4128) TaxID=1432307 RepID=W9C511_SCLBF|nr:hypothetical protein SBOR_9607 [Sclerotinia borealis F-4128]